MNRKAWLLIFLLVLAADIICIWLKQPSLEHFFKPLIVPALLTGFLITVRGIAARLSRWIVLALFFSWVGDVLLLFQDKKELFFLLGLAAFLVAHVCYIIFFHQVRVRENIKSNLWLLVPVVVYYAALISWLSPYLGDKKLPVRIYGIVISFMLMLALHMLYLANKRAGRLIALGAFLFIASDSILAVNKFYESFPLAGVLIILTYGLAQWLISLGASYYIREANTY